MDLYKAATNYIEVLRRIAEAEGELDEALDAELTITDDRLKEGTLFLIELKEQAETLNIGAKLRREQLTAFIKSNERAIELVKARLLEVVKRTGPLTTATYRLGTTTRRMPVLAEGARIDHKYCIHIPAVAEQYEPNLNLIGKALRGGEEIEGATLEDRTHLTVK